MVDAENWDGNIFVARPLCIGVAYLTPDFWWNFPHSGRKLSNELICKNDLKLFANASEEILGFWWSKITYFAQKNQQIFDVARKFLDSMVEKLNFFQMIQQIIYCKRKSLKLLIADSKDFP